MQSWVTSTAHLGGSNNLRHWSRKAASASHYSTPWTLRNRSWVDATSRKEKLAAEVNGARSKLQALYSPEELLKAIRAGNPELRLKLKNEIASRVKRIDIDFNERVAIIMFSNGFQNVLLLP